MRTAARSAGSWQLTRAFLRRTGSDIDSLRTSMARVEAGDLAGLEVIEHTAHSIHGAAAMFGFTGVSAAGGALERCARAAVDPHLVQRLTECIAALALATDAAEGAAPEGGGLFNERGSPT